MAVRNKYINIENLKKHFQEEGLSDVDEAVDEIITEFNKLIKSQKRKRIPKVDESYEQAEPFSNIYPEYDLSSLPSWIKENIDTARVLGNSKQTVLLPDGRRYQLNNTLNHMSGKEWTFFINSVINTQYRTSGADSYAHKIRKIHPTPKPPQLMRDIIEFFTKENELVIDYFMGVGGSLLGAALAGRRAIGIDLSQKYIDAYKAAADEIGCKQYTCINGDCLEVLNDSQHMEQLLGDDKISLVLLDPPYGNMMSREKTGADIKVYGNIATPFTTSKRDFGNLEIADFLVKLKESIELVLPYVKKRGYVVVFIKDLQPSGKMTNLLHAQIIEKLNEIPNLNYKGLKIWADQTAKLFPYGYPFSFVSNQIHQYILVFRKEK